MDLKKCLKILTSDEIDNVYITVGETQIVSDQMAALHLLKCWGLNNLQVNKILILEDVLSSKITAQIVLLPGDNPLEQHNNLRKGEKALNEYYKSVDKKKIKKGK